MTQIRIATAAKLLNVSDDTLRRWIDAGRIDSSLDAQGRKVVAGADLAALAQELALEDSLPDLAASGHLSSARNHLTGLVTAITSDVVMSQVELQCGRYRIVSLISTEAVRELDLKVGSIAAAVVKATNVSIDAAPKE